MASGPVTPPVGEGRRNVGLASWTTLGIGGPAERFYEPQTPAELAALLDRLHAEGAAWRMLGAGANLLIPDRGVAGAVIHTGQMRRVFRAGEPPQIEDGVEVEVPPPTGVHAWAGVSLPTLVRTAVDLDLGGIEWLVGVPGHVGGALAMNAGGRDLDGVQRAIWDCVETVGLWRPGEGPVEVEGRHHPACYRDGALGDAVVLEAVFQLERAAKGVVRERMAELLRRKNRSQPVTDRSAGCAFKNPGEQSAGRLLDEAGCKGMCVGAARVSERHANFILNEGGATASDVLELLERMAEAVERASGVALERELVVWRS